MAVKSSEHKGKLTKGEDDVERDGMLSPLYEEGEKGGNPESPAAEELDGDMTPPDPMGFLKHLGHDGRGGKK